MADTNFFAKRRQETEFFEWFDKANAIAEQYDITIYQVANARQIWDYAYAAGMAAANEQKENN